MNPKSTEESALNLKTFLMNVTAPVNLNLQNLWETPITRQIEQNIGWKALTQFSFYVSPLLVFVIYDEKSEYLDKIKLREAANTSLR